MSASSFVDVRHVYVDYAPPSSMLARLSGRKRMPHSVLRDVTFQLGVGEQVMLYGASGSGKTTLLRTLVGALKPSRGHVHINGKLPAHITDLAAGYVSAEESEPKKESAGQILHTFARTHGISNTAAQIGAVAEQLAIAPLLEQPAANLSTTQRLRVNLARAALSRSSLILLDDITDQLGAHELAKLLTTTFAGRAVIAATRSVEEAQKLQLPVMILHKGQMAHFGLPNDIAVTASCPRVVNAWVEGMRYDMLRSIKHHPGVIEVRLMPSDRFDGQQLRIVVRSSRYLPALYDLISQTPLIQVDEEPVTLTEILAHLK